MSANEAVPSQLTGQKTRASWLTRWCALTFIALALSTGVTCWTGTASYEEQLADIVAARGFSKDAYDAARESPTLKLLFLDAAGDRELTLKMELALIKYQDRARGVLEMFGGDTQFRQILLEHGEGVIPIIDYFISTDMVSLWAKAKLQGSWESIFDFFRKKRTHPANAEPSVYGPRLRGIYAIEAILVDGHHFLGQFVLDKKNQVQRVQTDRMFETIKKLFTSGVTGLESKYRMGDVITLPDVAWAGADVLSVFGVTKAVKYLGKAAVPGKAVEEAAVVRRTTMMGRSVLAGEAVGKRLAVMGSKVAAVYLLVRHPSLLSGVFGALGKLAGLPAWLSILIGWWGIALVAIVAILPLLRGVTLLIAPIRWIADAAVWAFPGRSLTAPDSK